jgi:hypothetical protein
MGWPPLQHQEISEPCGHHGLLCLYGWVLKNLCPPERMPLLLRFQMARLMLWSSANPPASPAAQSTPVFFTTWRQLTDECVSIELNSTLRD